MNRTLTRSPDPTPPSSISTTTQASEPTARPGSCWTRTGPAATATSPCKHRHSTVAWKMRVGREYSICPAAFPAASFQADTVMLNSVPPATACPPPVILSDQPAAPAGIVSRSSAVMTSNTVRRIFLSPCRCQNSQVEQTKRVAAEFHLPSGLLPVHTRTGSHSPAIAGPSVGRSMLHKHRLLSRWVMAHRAGSPPRRAKDSVDATLIIRKHCVKVNGLGAIRSFKIR